MNAPSQADSRRALQERDLYLRLLELTTQQEPTPFLAEALRLVTEVTGARTGYIEIHGEEPDGSDTWWMSHGFTDDEVQIIRDRISRGIIGEALATGEIVDTPSAMDDNRFSSRASVQGQQIEAVLCAPIGSDPASGILYLQGRVEPKPFSGEDREAVTLFARHLAPLAAGLRVRDQHNRATDPTRPYREQLNVSRLVGRSAGLAKLLNDISLVAPLDVSVLLTGQSGVGKGAAARIIHENGSRRDAAFIELNCAALPDSLVESELFGSLAGAHSTATRAMPGKVAAAEGGTLFLDEIGDLSANAQSKVLQLLQDHQYYPLGSSVPIKANVRVLAATNVDLELAMQEGRFREDLFYRLHVLPVHVPSLASRQEDIALLAEHFAADACLRHSLGEHPLTRAALRAIASSSWPGNVRQLANAIEAAAIRAAGEGCESIREHHIFPGSNILDDPRESLSYHDATREFQKRIVKEALDDTNWNVMEASRRLDLARSYLYNLIQTFGFKRGQ
jgi:Nif-specific regulatory protein